MLCEDKKCFSLVFCHHVIEPTCCSWEEMRLRNRMVFLAYFSYKVTVSKEENDDELPFTMLQKMVRNISVRGTRLEAYSRS